MLEHKQLTVDLGERSYPIWIGRGLLERLIFFLEKVGIDKDRKLLLISDTQVAPLYAGSIMDQLASGGYTIYQYTVPAGEPSKSLAEYERIITFALEKKLDRQSVVLALGGGVVGDLAGFVASTFMRGIPFIQIPTTILAHDSSVGGKVAINHPLGKNMIGAFHQPLAVIYDTKTLTSLPRREVLSGFAEVLKHGFIWDESFVNWLSDHRDHLLALEDPYLSEALYRGCSIKAQVVAQDEREQSLRAILNFGHTFGHAFEALGEYTRFTHGEAISIGMALASVVSDKYYGKTEISARVIPLIEAFGLPVDWLELPWTAHQVVEKMFADKKVVAGKLKLILLREVGKAEIVKEVDPEWIKEIYVQGRG